MTLVSLQAAAVQQGGGQRASRKRGRQPSEQAEQEARRPLRTSRQEAAGSADDAQAAGAQPAAAAAPTTTCIQPDKAAALRRAAQAAAKLAETERRRGELLEAYQAFQEQATQRLMFMEVDAGKLSPRQLEGRTVRVYWPGDDAWYLAQVKAYCKDTGNHKLHYADGERQEELLALERVRLLVHAGEELPLASGASLSATMGLLRRLLQSAECVRDPARKNLLQQRLTELTAYAKQRYGEEAQEEELLRSTTLASRSGLGPTATAHTSARSGDRGCGGRSSCGGTGGTAAIQRALALAAQERSSDRAHQVQQGQHAQRRAPELGHPLKGQTQQPGIKQQGIEQQGMEQQQPEAVEPLVAADYAEAGEEEEEEVAEHEPAHQELPLAKDAGADAKLKHGEPDADREEMLAAAGGAAQGDQLAPAVASCPAAPAHAAMAALPSEGGQEGAAAAAAGREPAPARRLRVGEVGWFQVRGYPHWPFLVITPEEALARGLPAKHLKNPAFLAVQYFGTAEVSGVNPLAVEKGASKKRAGAAPCFGPFLDGLERGWHVPMQCNKANQFRVALAELETYFKEGNLPPSMVSKNNTDGEAEDEEQLDAEAEPGPAPKQAAKRRKSQAKTGRTAGADDSSGPLDLPLQLNKMLAVVALGKVEWLHPAFHNEKAIFPPGYCAERLARTPASGGEEVLHVMEVCRALNGSGPLFRVTPQDCPPVEGPTATKAWQALYVSDEAGAARSLNLSGELMFGLSHPRVQRAIRALPNAQRCERYCGWSEGQQPEPVPLSPKEQRERLACEARMQHLPEGIQPQPGPERQPGICHVCDEEEETDVNLVMQCNGCNLFVHMNCYGVEEPPNGQLWLCDVCALGLSAPPPCVLCPVMGGALRRTTCGRWAHVACCDYVPETHLDPDKGTINGVAQVHRSRFQLTCQVCKQRHGACTQCCDPRCYQGFHPLCARRAGHRMERVEDSDGEDDECEEDEVEAAQQPSTSQAPSLPTGRDGSCDENDASAPNGNSKRPGSRGRGRGRASGAGKARRGQHQEGVVLDDGSRLLAFCRKHSQTASAAAGMLPLGHPQQQSTGAAAAADAEPRASLPLSGGDAQLAAQQAGQQVQQAAAGPAPPPPPMSHPWGSARAAPFHPAARRGSRAPEAVAAAEAKRGYVLSQPYLVGGTLRHELVLSSSREQWRPADAPPSARRLLPPGAVQGQVHSLALPDAQAANADLLAQQRQQQGAAPPPPGSQQEQQADGGAASTPRPPPLVTPRRAASGLGSPPSGVPQLAASPRARCKSDAERYREMVATQGQRVTIGKSGIHGWGAFAKTRHPAHTMVIEYVGELVRESVVTEVREKRWYNDMVGAGTYVFRLGGDSALCVDATRAGNLAHMLNHSCQPNCYSRTIRFVENGRGVDRVIITALRDIEPWEELTYDYRFGGDEKLPCNCGAPSCRGYVNEKSSSSGQVWAPRSQLRPFNPPKSGLNPAAAESAPAVRPPMAAQRGDLQLCVAAQQPAAVASPPAAQDQQPAVLEQQMAAQQPAPMEVEPAPARMQQAQFDVQQETQQLARSQPRQEAAAAAPAAQHYQSVGRLLPQPEPGQEVQQQQQQQQPHAAEAAAMFLHTQQQQQQQQQWMPQEAYEQRRCAAQLPGAQHPTAATAEEVLTKQLQQPPRSALPAQEPLTTLAGQHGLPPPLLWPQSLQ